MYVYKIQVINTSQAMTLIQKVHGVALTVVVTDLPMSVCDTQNWPQGRIFI